MALPEAPLDEARLLAAEPQSPRDPRPRDEEHDVRHRHDGDEHHSGRTAERAGGDRGGHADHPETDESLELERLVTRADPRGDDGAQPEHRREVEGARPDDDPDRDLVPARDERGDCGRELGRVGRECREEAE